MRRLGRPLLKGLMRQRWLSNRLFANRRAIDFVLQELAQRDQGFYSFDDLLLEKIRTQLLTMA